MLEERRSEETARRLAEAKERGDSLLPPLGLAFWRAKRAFEREVGLSAAAWFLLSILIEKDGISQGEVSRRFEIDPSRITRLAQRLQDEGLLRRERDPEDTQVMRLHATEEGRLLIENGRERRDGLEDRIRRELSEEELAEFKRLLGVVAQVMAN